MSENKECFACHGKGCYMCAEKKPVFTWEDVENLREAADASAKGELLADDWEAVFSELANRIMAHLPPRNK